MDNNIIVLGTFFLCSGIIACVFKAKRTTDNFVRERVRSLYYEYIYTFLSFSFLVFLILYLIFK
jgi:uncharacterized membrane protein HdeD (DUF308 family)